MKKLYIAETLDVGGAERLLVEELSQEMKAGHEVSLVLMSSGALADTLPKGVDVVVLMTKWIRRRMAALPGLRNILCTFWATMHLRGRRFDIATAWIEGPASRLHASLLRYGIRNEAYVHSDPSAHTWYDWDEIAEGKYYHSLDRILCVTRAVENSFRRRHPALTNIAVRLQEIDAEKIRREAAKETIPHDRFRICSVGRLVEVKRVDRLIDAASMLAAGGRDFEVVIIGDGPLRTQLEALAAEKGIGDRVRFLGMLSNPWAMMAASDVVCITSDSEGRSLVAAEAKVLGIRIVTTPLPAVEEQIEEGDVVAGFAPADISAALEKLMA